MTIEFGTPRKLVGVDILAMVMNGNGEVKALQQFTLDQSKELADFKAKHSYCKFVAIPIWTK